MAKMLTIPQIYAASREAGWNHAQAVIATAVSLAESGGQLDAVSPVNTDGSVDRGPFQVNSIHGYDAAKLTSDLQYSANAAHDIYEKQGWGAWTVWKSGAFRSEIPKVTAAKLKSNESWWKDVLKSNPVTGVPFREAEIIGGATGIDGIPNPIEAAKGVADIATEVWGTLKSADFWKRVGFIVAGGVGVTIALLIVASEFSNKLPMPPVVKALT